MNTIAKFIAFPLAMFFCLLIMQSLAIQIVNATYTPTFWLADDGVQYDSLSEITTYLRENGWVSELVSDDQLEYELLLAEQLASTSDHVSAELLIAQIAQESQFDPDTEYNGAIGLMQILPNYHQDKLEHICEDPTFDKWYEPRYNIMVGIMYMDELFSEEYACGDTAYALMMYNQGPVSASKTYLGAGIVSDYASSIITLKRNLEDITMKGDTSNGTPS